ncbi:MAG: Extracellular solute-binding protein family 1 [Acetothermia bacterium 64_32]|nr:MAG: Extracellular solute-binding protein family 1 [Acetothermia bacterium 64_32]HAF71063.1 ABC transporter substrate-binding protein [Candidatus Acetothermia bacterium]
MKRGCLLVTVLVLFSFGWVLAREKTQITFWHAMGGWRVEFIERMVADFNLTHPDIEVTVEYKGSYRDTLNAALAAARAGDAPHIVHSFEVGTQMNLDSGIFVPLEDLIDQYGLIVPWEDYIDPALNYYRVSGRLYCMPWNSSNPILYYNKTLLNAAGVEMPKKPTFEDIISISRAVKEKGLAEYGITWCLHSWYLEQWMADMGVDLVNNDNGRSGYATEINLLDPAAIKIMEWWKQLYDEGLWVNPGRENWSQARQVFISGQSAMLISSTSDVTLMENAAVEQGFELGTAFIPVPSDYERHGVVIGGGALWVTGGHPDSELRAAAEFVVWMTQVAQTIRWHQGTGYFPIRKTARTALEMEGWFDRYPNYRTALDQLQETQPITATQGALMGNFLEARTFIEDAIEAILAGTPVPEALAGAKAKIDQGLQDYLELVGG